MVTKSNPKKSWLDDIVDVGELNLDLQNPRIPKHIKEQNDETLIRNYLLEKEDVLRIAKSIANNGYHKSAISITVKQNGAIIVLDGNRRLAACQLLLKPGLAPNARDRKALEELSKVFNKDELKRIKIAIAPSRKDAEKEIWDVHVNRLLKSWEQIQRLRMYKNLIDEKEFDIATAAKEYGTTKGKFTNELAKLYFYEWILELGDNDVEEKMRDAGFNAIERLIISKNGKKFFDYTVSSGGKVTFKNKQEAGQKLKKIMPYITGDTKIPAQATQEWLIDNVFSKIDPDIFAKRGTPKRKSAKKVSLKTQKKDKEYFKELALKRRRSSRRYPLNEAEEIVEYVLVHFDVVAEQLLDRHSNRETIKINDEYDAQDLLHALLAMFFDDIDNEEWNQSDGGAPSRGDFLLLDNGTIIEVKTTLKRSSDIRKKLEKELNDDMVKYSRRFDCRRIYFFIYDPEKKIKKPTTFERAITHNRFKNIVVKTIVNRA